jgi:hypothetical protein
MLISFLSLFFSRSSLKLEVLSLTQSTSKHSSQGTLTFSVATMTTHLTVKLNVQLLHYAMAMITSSLNE